MPDVTGIDVIKESVKLAKRPKVGLITAWDDISRVSKDKDLKVDFVIKKPFDLSELSRCINDVLGG